MRYRKSTNGNVDDDKCFVNSFFEIGTVLKSCSLIEIYQHVTVWSNSYLNIGKYYYAIINKIIIAYHILNSGFNKGLENGLMLSYKNKE